MAVVAWRSFSNLWDDVPRATCLSELLVGNETSFVAARLRRHHGCCRVHQNLLCALIKKRENQYSLQGVGLCSILIGGMLGWTASLLVRQESGALSKVALCLQGEIYTPWTPTGCPARQRWSGARQWLRASWTATCRPLPARTHRLLRCGPDCPSALLACARNRACQCQISAGLRVDILKLHRQEAAARHAEAVSCMQATRVCADLCEAGNRR